ncbi:MAG: dihydrodipicolinate synthase family protein [Acidobacteria bacterium]|nr:dihydrodipicolinate synthase family protein [Acidobacteriota bacterium]
MNSAVLGDDEAMNVHGVYVAAVTPRKPNSTELDLGGALGVIDYLNSTRANGIALMGSTGEFLHFEVEERVRLASLVIKRSRIPVVVCVAHSTLEGAVRMAQEAEKAGAAGLLLMPPYFFRYPQDAVKAFFRGFIAQAGVRIPTYLYNIPFFSTELAVETSLELLESGAFAGIKDSCGKMEYYERLRELRNRQEFTLVIGNDNVFTRAKSVGIDGLISGCACPVPELMIGLSEAIEAGNATKRDLLQGRLEEFIKQIDQFPTPIGVKAATEVRGMKLGPLATPLGEERERLLSEFKEWFQGWLPVIQQEAGA